MTHTNTKYDIPYLNLKRITEMHLDELTQAVTDTIRSGWYLQGEATMRFENNYAKYIGTKHCIGMGNGLDALTLTLRALMELGRIQRGDEVIVPANTFLATVLAVTDNGLKPVMVDVDEETLCMNVSNLKASITDKTRALMLVHLYGRCSCNEELLSFCCSNNLLLIEDNAQAQGCHYLADNKKTESKKTGAIGTAGCHSFYPGKNLGAMGDGGAVTTDDDELAAMLRMLSNYGFSRKYMAELQGRNSRLDEIQAAVLNTKLRYLDYDNSIRNQYAHTYYNNIHNPHVNLPRLLNKEENVYHIFPIFSPYRNELQAWLSENGIHTLIHYPVPPHLQACYPEMHHLHFPTTEKLTLQELSLPLNPAMSIKEIEYVAETINAFRTQMI